MRKKISGDELAVGGQAVLEGVMMRGRDKWAVSVRNPEGNIVNQVTSLKKHTGWRRAIRKAWFIRGSIAMVDSLKIGYAALDYSADVAISEETSKKTWLDGVVTIGMFIVSLVFALFLFKFVPFWLGGLFVAGKSFVLLEGLIKIVIFVGYLLLISLSKQIRSVFEYHGAEHKVVHCYEKYGLSKKLTATEAQKESRIHPRCGTTFMFLVVLVSIFVYAIIPIPVSIGFWMAFVIRILFLPVIAGISFEILQLVPKLSRKNPVRWVLYIFEYPGLLLQKITTREPKLEQLEVAIDALKRAV